MACPRCQRHILRIRDADHCTIHLDIDPLFPTEPIPTSPEGGAWESYSGEWHFVYAPVNHHRGRPVHGTHHCTEGPAA